MQNDLLFDIIVNHSANEILIAATSQSGISGNKTTSNFGNSDFWLLKTDANGAILDQYTYGGSGDDTFFKILLLDDDYLLCGISDSPVSGNKLSPNRGNSDYWVIKTDFNGNIIWDNIYGGECRWWN